MFEVDRKVYLFNIKDIWWADRPYDVDGCDGVTFHACKNKINLEGFNRSEFTTLTIDLTQELDSIWKNMSKSSCRYAINRAKRDGVKIRINQNYEDFYQMNKSFRRNKGLSASFESIEFMKKYGTLFISEVNGEILSGQFYLKDNEHMRWLIGASKRLDVDAEKATLIGNANRLLIWEAINYAKGEQIKVFDFGGYYMGEKEDEQKSSINTFKESFGGSLNTYYIYKKYYSQVYKFLRWLWDRQIK